MSKGVQRIFTEAARTYEMINHLLTFGLDVILRKKAAEIASRNEGAVWLDVCSGTGEMAAELRRVSNPDRHIISSDFTLDMLRYGSENHNLDGIGQLLADSGALPFPSNSVDLVTISYATRNLNPTRSQLRAYLGEFLRVLRPGGLFINLETSQPEQGIIRMLYHMYVRSVVRRVGQFISGSKSGYAFLSYTVPRFYGIRQFAHVIRSAGFRNVCFQPFFLGLFAVHTATAP